MTRCLNWCLLFLCLQAAPMRCVSAEGSAERPAIAIVPMGSIDAETLAGLSNHVRSCFYRPVVVTEALPAPDASSADEEIAKLAAQAAPGALCTLGIRAASETAADEPLFITRPGVGILNLGSSDLALAGRRVDRPPSPAWAGRKSAVRCLALGIGMKPCIMPRCVLCLEAAARPEGDITGANLCPPCQGKAERVLQRVQEYALRPKASGNPSEQGTPSSASLGLDSQSRRTQLPGRRSGTGGLVSASDSP